MKLKSAISIQCLPMTDADKEEVYKLVDEAIKVIDSSGLPYKVGPFETTIEGDLDQLIEVAKEAHKAVLKAGSKRVFTYIKLASGEDLGSTEEKVGKYNA